MSEVPLVATVTTVGVSCSECSKPSFSQSRSAACSSSTPASYMLANSTLTCAASVNRRSAAAPRTARRPAPAQFRPGRRTGPCSPPGRRFWRPPLLTTGTRAEGEPLRLERERPAQQLQRGNHIVSHAGQQHPTTTMTRAFPRNAPPAAATARPRPPVFLRCRNIPVTSVDALPAAPGPPPHDLVRTIRADGRPLSRWPAAERSHQPRCRSRFFAALPCLITSAFRSRTWRSHQLLPPHLRPDQDVRGDRYPYGETIVVGLGGPDGQPVFWLGPPTSTQTRELHSRLQGPRPRRGGCGAPGRRWQGASRCCTPRAEFPEYHPGYYGVFLRDPDGHNIEAVHHG